MPRRLALLVISMAAQFLAMASVGAQAREPADLILHNGKVVTLDARNSVASAVIIRDGTIVAVGDASLLAHYQATRTIDLRGRMLMPGFNDAHTHISGDARRYIDLTSVRSIRELQDKHFTRVFNILHGHAGGGEDGVLQGLLDALNVPYTGSGVLGSALSMDKIRTKQVWLSVGLPTPRYVQLGKGADVHAAAKSLGLP